MKIVSVYSENQMKGTDPIVGDMSSYVTLTDAALRYTHSSK
jgi:hypothetical protein